MVWVMPSLFVRGWLGGMAGLGISSAMGMIMAWAASLLTQQALAESFAVLRAPNMPLVSTGSADLDELLVELRDQLEHWRRVKDDVEALERLSQSLREVAGSAAASGSPIAAVLGQLRHTVGLLLDDVRALSSASERISNAAATQEAPLAQATVTLESLFENTQQISENSGSAAQATEQARMEVHRGLEQVRGMIESMERIRAHVDNNGRKVRQLGERSVEIGAITELIEGISKRTENLAINSEIAAARAGEHGREFSVVASEIRKLSERTAAATRDIGSLVEAIQADTTESIRSFSEEQSEVEREVSRVREAGAALERINEASERSAALVDGISRSANEQVAATSQVVNMMTEVLQITQQTVGDAAMTREHVMMLARNCDQLQRLAALDPSYAALGGVRAAAKPRGGVINPIPAPASTTNGHANDDPLSHPHPQALGVISHLSVNEPGTRLPGDLLKKLSGS